MTTRERIVEHLELIDHRARVAASRYGEEPGSFVGSGYLGLVRAAETFDPEQTLSFETYASRLIDYAIIDERRARRGRVIDGAPGTRLQHTLSTVSLFKLTAAQKAMDTEHDRGLTHALRVDEDPADPVDERDYLETRIRQIAGGDARLETLIRGRLDGRFDREIAERLGLHPSRICQMRKELKRRCSPTRSQPPQQPTQRAATPARTHDDSLPGNRRRSFSTISEAVA